MTDINTVRAIINGSGNFDGFSLNANNVTTRISGSGNSENVVRAMTYAKEQGVKTLALSGFNGGKISKLADVSVHADVMDMEVCEDIHMIIFNIIKKEMQATLMGDNPSMGKVYDDRVS